MKRMLLSAAVSVMTICGAATPASACMTVQQQVTIHPLTEAKPIKASRGIGTVFKIRYDGARAGEIDKLWPNYYAVEVLSGKLKGQEVLIPAHITSCHSVHIPKGVEGYVVGTLERDSREAKRFGRPILSTGFNGRRQGFEIPGPGNSES
jgi:hypothetical protein